MFVCRDVAYVEQISLFLDGESGTSPYSALKVFAVHHRDALSNPYTAQSKTRLSIATPAICSSLCSLDRTDTYFLLRDTFQHASVQPTRPPRNSLLLLTHGLVASDNPAVMPVCSSSPT